MEWQLWLLQRVLLAGSAYLTLGTLPAIPALFWGVVAIIAQLLPQHFSVNIWMKPLN
ncbi:hypothetical protein PRBEI_2001237700 [Prionailurus iriomotensis]